MGNSKSHYSEQFMPGALTATHTPTKSLSFDDESAPAATPKTKQLCKDNMKSMDLQQIFNKLQVSVDEEIEEKNQKNAKEKGGGTVLDMRRIWVKSLVLATHFVTAVWLTLKEDIECNQ